MDLKNNVYVRCPLFDKKYLNDPRDFIVGRIISVDDSSEQLAVSFLDPFGYRAFYDDIPKEYVYSTNMVSRCELYKGTRIRYNGKTGKIICLGDKSEGEYRYYVQLVEDNSIVICREVEIEAPFIGGKISPIVQLCNYEFQHPAWYLGRSVVNRVNKILDNSILGFKELAGCKIFLMPHQLNTIMRCKQDKCCRYMLADEVGMGKTIEASAVLKLFLSNNCQKRVVIITPNFLKEQWRTELFFKFDIVQGVDFKGNCITLMTFSEFEQNYCMEEYDFVIIDEVHRLINEKNYHLYHTLSQKTVNLLLLSATPLQRMTLDFLKLLRLLDPTKYDVYSKESFEELVTLQSKLAMKVMVAINDIDDLQEEIKGLENEDVRQDRTCLDIFESIKADLESISSIIHDNAYDKLLNDISVEDKDLNINQIYIAISYVCENYKLDRSIIRNRRNILYNDEYASHTRPIRKMYKEIRYQTGASEYTVYQLLLESIEEDKNLSIDKLISVYKPLLNAYFSSACAFYNVLRNNNSICSDELNKAVQRWVLEEKNNADNIIEILNNPTDYEDRMLKVIDYLDQELFDEKVVIFTSFQETFNLYRTVLEKIYETPKLSFFNSNMPSEELELNVYRFQNDKDCHILLCDKSGGEGRNFQIADYIIHVDIPWEANEIEQRIGRLDRLERAPERPNVYSVVVISEGSLEQQLFKFWNEGLNVFEESLSGLEIVLEDINKQIFSAIISNIKYGLFGAVSNILETTTKLKKEIKREQRQDAIGYLYKPVNKQISKLIRYYTEKDDELFSETMLKWASLAGFKSSCNNKIISFYAREFQWSSARNALLIPPNLIAYKQSKQVEFITRINELYSNYKEKVLNDGYKDIVKPINGEEIKGTFNREIAISNDYLHFFAPGDAIFDCIVENAVHSARGQVAAFVLNSDIEWEGIIYTFSVIPNERWLLSKGILMTEIAYFRNFLTSDVAIVPISFGKYLEVPNELVIKEYNNLISKGFDSSRSRIVHLGKRGKGGSEISLQFGSNLDWFKNRYPKDLWNSYVEDTFNLGKKQAVKELHRKCKLNEAKEEIQRLIAAQVSSDTFYGRKGNSEEELEKKYSIIFESLKNPIISVDSACYVLMVR